MSDKAKTCARLLGWTWRDDARGILPKPGEVLVGPDGDRFVVRADRPPWVMVGGVHVAWREHYTVDLASLMIGACVRNVRDLDAMEHVPGSTVQTIVTVPEAVIMAAARRCGACSGLGGVTASGEPATTDMCRTVCNHCGGRGRTPGHEGARAALTRLAEGWREHLPVIGDWFEDVGGLAPERVRRAASEWCAQTGQGVGHWLSASMFGLGDPRVLVAAWRSWLDEVGMPPGPQVLAECPALPAWVLAWLEGECPAGCEPDGNGVHCLWLDASCRRRKVCDVCYVYGSAIARHVDAIWAYLDAVSERDGL